MTPSPIERKVRTMLPIVRFMQVYLPLRWSAWLTKQGMAQVRLPVEVRRDSVSADGVPCEWVIPQNGPADQVLLYLHGGGFVYGLSPLHLQMLGYLAQKMGVRVLAVEYRLAPEHPFPASLDDCITAYYWLLKQGFPSQKIVVAGDSAGGNLTITMMMKLRDGYEPLPAAAACLSPVANLSDRDNHPTKGFKDPLLPPKAVRTYSKSYIARNDAHDPLISPVFGDWHGLPPLLIHVGEDEILREDAVLVEELAKAAGVNVRLEIYPRMWHVWQIYLKLPQAVQSLDDIARFLKSQLR
jgi:epsilon-lactone hydrolase